MRISETLHHFAVAVDDLAASVEWYMTKLDFKIEKRFVLDAQLEIVKLKSAGGVRMELLKDASRPTTVPTGLPLTEPGSKHVCFHVDDIEETARELRARGVVLTQEPKTIHESGERNCWIVDNEGNMIEFIEEMSPG